MPTLTLLVGIPACGKSTHAKKFADASIIILSSDAIRKELLNDETNQKNNPIIFAELYKRARNHLQNGLDVIIDATNISIFDRNRVLQNFTDMEIKRKAVVIQCPVEECIKRDSKRERSVGKDVIFRYARNYQPPTLDEGFDDVIFIENF